MSAQSLEKGGFWVQFALRRAIGSPMREAPDRNRVPVESAGMADHVMENSKWRFTLKWAAR